MDIMTEATVVLEAHICNQRRSYLVGFATEDQAMSFINRRMSTHAFHTVEDSELPADWSRLNDFFEPESCEHGLSAWLCEGPGHYPN